MQKGSTKLNTEFAGYIGRFMHKKDGSLQQLDLSDLWDYFPALNRAPYLYPQNISGKCCNHQIFP